MTFYSVFVTVMVAVLTTPVNGFMKTGWSVERINKRSLDSSVNWALDRINERERVFDGKIGEVAEGDLYVIGGGVRGTHAEFGGRVLEGWSHDNSDNREDCSTGGVSTGAASIAIGSHLGVARTGNVFPVKVGCGGYFSNSDLSRGLQWITSHMSSLRSNRAVILMTYEVTSHVQELDALAASHLVVLPAGDGGSNRCGTLSQYEEVGITIVGSSTKSDEQAPSSNYGDCLDLFAPGAEVLVASASDDTLTQTKSGTVYAAAAVAGTALNNLKMTTSFSVDILKSVLLSRSTKGVLTLSPSASNAGTPNKLLFDICPYYQRPDYGKCYVSQTAQLIDTSSGSRLQKAAKSVVTFDDMAYNYFEDCFTVLLFGSAKTEVRVLATHDREGRDLEVIKEAVFRIELGNTTIVMESGPKITIDSTEVPLDGYVAVHAANYRLTKEDREVRTQEDSRRFMPLINVDLPQDITVSFDGHQQVRIELKDVQLFKEATEGICGFMDNSHVTEFVDPDGNKMEFTFSKNKEEFVRTWMTSDQTCETKEDLCDDTGCLEKAEQVCNPLKDPAGPYNMCFEVKDPSSWYSNCVDAVKQCCCDNTDTKKCACEEQEKYWWAVTLEKCYPPFPCDEPCEKQPTDPQCIDNAGRRKEFIYPEKIEYLPKDECHYVDTHNSTQCLHHGKWKQEVPDCKVKTCDKPGLTEFTNYVAAVSDSYNCGDQVDYQCSKTQCDCNCYGMSGSSQLSCISAGQRVADWDYRPPTCSLKYCPEPTAPAVDKEIESDKPLSSVVSEDKACCSGRAQYSCGECYDLEGVSEAKCCDSQWGAPPLCKLKKCADPNIEVEESGDAHLVVTTSQGIHCSHVIQYSCNSDCYEIKGDSARACQTDSSWSGSLPKCVKKKCPPVSDYDNGDYMFDGEPVSDAAILECGDVIAISCTACHFPCTAACTRTCQWSGSEMEWSNGSPICQEFRCPARRVQDGSVDKRRSLACGESSRATCDTCYTPTAGSPVRKCVVPESTLEETCPITNTEGVYQGEELVCQRMQCPRVEIGDNVQIVSNTCSDEEGSEGNCNCQISFQCASDCHKMTGEATISCVDGAWDYAVPTCQMITCSWADIEPDVSRKYTYEDYYNEFVGGCKYKKLRDGDVVNPEDTFNCGDVLYTEADSRECYHVCHKANITCTETGKWDVARWQIPTCVYMTCDAPDPVDHAHREDTYSIYNCTTEVEYSCATCYKHVSGDLRRRCIGDDAEKGAWSGEAPVCKKMSCDLDKLPDIANGTIVSSDGDGGLQCGQKLRVSCNECSVLVGSSDVLCADETVEQGDTTSPIVSWLNYPLTSCQPMCCPPLTSLRSGDPSYDVISTSLSFLHGEHAVPVCGASYVCQEMEAKCDECYEYNESDYAPTRKCEKGDSGTGYWTNEEKICRRKECLVEIIPSENHLHYTLEATTKKCNEQMEVECDQCHKLSDTQISDTRQCLPDKTWSKALPVCVPVTCQEPGQIENGEKKYLQSSDNSACQTVLYECDKCFRLVGEATLSCNQDQGLGTAKWSAAPPVCEPICCEHIKDPVDPILKEVSTRHTYQKSSRDPLVNLADMSVTDNYANCDKDYVCQIIDPKCEACFEYLLGDTPPTKECKKKQLGDGTWVGEWSNKDEMCTLKQCPYRELEEAQHIHYAAPHNYSPQNPAHCRAQVTLTCDTCFELNDGSRSETHTCQETKQWSQDVPTCKRSECRAPPAVPHCTYNTGDNLCDHTKTLSCEECYFEEACRSQGVSEVTCGYDKEWTWATKEPRMIQRQCEAAPEIDNGTVDSSGAGCGDMARYRCDRCYTFSHDSDCLCEKRKCIPDPNDCTKGMWNETAPVCEKITCGAPPPAPTNGALVSVDDTCDGKVVYECDKGHYLTAGDLERTCTEWGKWSGQHPVCQVKQCTPITPTEHRTQTTLSYTYDTVVHFQCEQCYQFTSSFTDESVKDDVTINPRFHWLHCNEHGNWNGSVPVCQLQTCSNPGAPPNGKLADQTPDFSCSSSVTFQCNEGYKPTADSTMRMTCLGEVWSSPLPSCEPIDCGNIEVVNPLRVDADITLYGYMAVFECGGSRNKRCFEDTAPLEAECQADGTWSGVPSGCVRRQCQALPPADNGVWVKRNVKLGETDCQQTYDLECEEGYRNEGPTYVSCLGTTQETTWYPAPLPRCLVRKCPLQGDPKYGQVQPGLQLQKSGTGAQFGSKLTYKCDECYKLSGAEVRECVGDGDVGVAWEHLQPECLVTTCELPALNRGYITSGHSASNLPVCNDVVKFQCDYGYKLIGHSEIRCKGEGGYDTVVPTCSLITCPFPGFTSHVTNSTYPEVRDGVFLPLTEVFYECDEGYELEGAETLLCEMTGTWSSRPPTCRPSVCEDIGPVANGFKRNVSEVEIEVGCDRCYRLDGGDGRMKCRNGHWDPPHAPSCEKKKCYYTPYQIGNGRTQPTQASYDCGDEVTHTCRDGFRISGPSKHTCSEQGVWEPKNNWPVCHELECPELEEVTNANTTYDRSNGGMSVHYQCDEGYRLYGDATRQCFNGTQWSGPGPTRCEVIHCGHLGSTMYGSVAQVVRGLEAEEDTPGARVKYQCKDSRYQLIGSAERTCLSNGVWDGIPPSCECHTCPLLAIENGVIETADENKVGTTVQYICDDGFKLRGLNSRECQENGEWSGDAPSCAKIKCGKPPRPEGSLQISQEKAEYNYQDLAEFKCAKWSSKIIVKCGFYGKWVSDLEDLDKACSVCKEVTRTRTEYYEKTYPGECHFGQCEPETTRKIPVTKQYKEIVCD